jgi:hypothetical protein
MRERDMLVVTTGIRRMFDQGAFAVTGAQRAGEWSWAKAIGLVTAGLVFGALLFYVLGGSVAGYAGLVIVYVAWLFRARQMQVDYLERERVLSEGTGASAEP